MNKLILLAIIMLISSILLLIYISHGKEFMGTPTKGADILGTEGYDNNVFHQLLIPQAHLYHDGIILAFEKVKRKRLVWKAGDFKEYTEADQYKLFDIDPSLKAMDEHGFGWWAKRLVKAISATTPTTR